MKPGNIREMTLTAMFTALTLAATMFVNIRLPIAANGGLVHLGNVPLFVAAAVLGRRPAALSGAVGMALFDLISGWAVWAPGTFIIVGCMGLAAGAIMGRLRGAGGYVLAAAAAAAMGTSPANVRISSYKKTSRRSAWSMAGRREQIAGL